MKGLSTLEEVKKKGDIFEILPSTIKENVWIVIHELGHQSNINEEVFQKLHIQAIEPILANGNSNDY